MTQVTNLEKKVTQTKVEIALSELIKHHQKKQQAEADLKKLIETCLQEQLQRKVTLMIALSEASEIEKPGIQLSLDLTLACLEKMNTVIKRAMKILDPAPFNNNQTLQHSSHKP